MKLRLSILVGMLLSAVPLWGAQSISIRVSFDRDQYILGEDVTAKVEITNFSGQTLALAGDVAWLTFNVDGDAQRSVPQRAPTVDQEKFDLESAMKATYRANLTPLFDLSQPGRYRVRAIVRVADLKMAVESAPVSFQVISGAIVWNQDFGVPQPQDSPGGELEIRRYALLSVRHDRDQLYFRLSDARTGKVFQVLHIGPLVTFKPEAQLDQWSNLHVLYQYDARAYLYTMISPEGVRLVRESYEIGATRPRLEPQTDGRIKVGGGVRKYRSDDLPPSLSRVGPNSLAPDAVVPQP